MRYEGFCLTHYPLPLTLVPLALPGNVIVEALPHVKVGKLLDRGV